MEKNSYPDELLKWLKEQNWVPRNFHLVLFLKVREDVRAALVAGYSVKHIWTCLREADRIQCSYSRFLFHVNCMRGKGKPALRPAAARTVALAAGTEKLPEPGGASTGGRAQGGKSATRAFVFNPVPDPKILN